MGKLVYGMPSISVEFDDRLLAHLKIVIAAKLRRDESFMFTWDVAGEEVPTQSSVWLHPAIPLQFETTAMPDSSINREWLEQLSRSSNSPSGLRVVAEPVADSPGDAPGTNSPKRSA